MKLQYLAVIFIVIIMPIVMVLSEYIDYQIDAINLKHTYNTKLLDATYDSIKAYQLNTINNAISDISATKIEDLEAAVNAFFNSLTTNFNYTGYNSSIMKDYVPAVVFTMYDGYYIYSPYRNVLTGVSRDDIDEDYEDNSILHGIKPYVYYSCRYIKDGNDFVITYTLDNYITIQGTINGRYVNDYGYLIDGITKSGDEYTYDGVVFKEDSKEDLKEYLGDTEYSYAKINGTKYYLDGNEIFYINATGERAIQITRNSNLNTFERYKKYITENNTAYRYYKSAYEFTNRVRNEYKLGSLKATDAVDFIDDDGNVDKISDTNDYFGNMTIFGEDDDSSDNITGSNLGIYIQDSDSNFNQHRSSVIRYTIEKNLSAAITGYEQYSNAPDVEFIMPNISETDWATLENNISIITFLQGFNIAGKNYNEYCVVANNLNKEYVDENDIYILGNDGMYYKPNDTNISSNINTGLRYLPGVWKVNFERKNFRQPDGSTKNYSNYYYYPVRYRRDSPYLASYSSVVSHSESLDNSEVDLYKYMRKSGNYNLKRTYYTALARERWGSYSVNNDIDISKDL